MLVEARLQSVMNTFDHYCDTDFPPCQSRKRAKRETGIITIGLACNATNSCSSGGEDFTQIAERPTPIPYIFRNGSRVLAVSPDQKRMGMHFDTGVAMLRSAEGTLSSLNQPQSIRDDEDDARHSKCPTLRSTKITPKFSEEPIYARLVFDPEWSLPMRCAFEERDRSDLVASLEERGEISPQHQDAIEAIQEFFAKEEALYLSTLARNSCSFLTLVNEPSSAAHELISCKDERELRDLLTEIRIHPDASPFIVPFGPRSFFDDADVDLATDQIDNICQYDSPYWSSGQIHTWQHSLPSRIPMVQVSGFLDSLPSYYSGTDILQNDAKLRECWPLYRKFRPEDSESSPTESSMANRQVSDQSGCSTGTINDVYPDQSLFTDSRVSWLNVKLVVKAPSPLMPHASNSNSMFTLQTQPQVSTSLSNIQTWVMRKIKSLSWRPSRRHRGDNDSDITASRTPFNLMQRICGLHADMGC